MEGSAGEQLAQLAKQGLSLQDPPLQAPVVLQEALSTLRHLGCTHGYTMRPVWAQLAACGKKVVEVTTYAIPLEYPAIVVLCCAAAGGVPGRVAVAVVQFMGYPMDEHNRPMAVPATKVAAMAEDTGIPPGAWDTEQALPLSFASALRNGHPFYCCKLRVLFRIPKAAAFCVPYRIGSQNPFIVQGSPVAQFDI